MAGDGKTIPSSVKNIPRIRILRAQLAAEGEARRLQKFHVCARKRISQLQVDKALDKFDDEWMDHEDEVINAECEEMLALAGFAEERLKKWGEKFGRGKQKKKKD